MTHERSNSQDNARTYTMTSTNNPTSVLGGVVFSKIRCYLSPGQIGGKKLFQNKPKIQLVFTYNKKQKYTTKSEMVNNTEKKKKRANWTEQIYFELLSNVSTEFTVSVYNTAISGPDGRLGEAIGNFKDLKKFRIEENRITLELVKQGEERIGEVFFHAVLLSCDPPKNMMDKISDPNNRAKKIGMLLINNVKFKNLAGRRGTLEVKLKDESHSTDGYWNTTTKEWRYPIALNIIANSSLDLIIQCRYTEHERALTRISLGPDGAHEHIWKNLMNGPCKVGEFPLQDQEFDCARIEFTLSCHKILCAKTLFNLEEEEGESESPFLDTNQIDEEETYVRPTRSGTIDTVSSRTDTINTVNTIGRADTINAIGRTDTISTRNGYIRNDTMSTRNGYGRNDEQNDPRIPTAAISVAQRSVRPNHNHSIIPEEDDSNSEFQRFDYSSFPKPPQQLTLPPPPLSQPPLSQLHQQLPISPTSIIGDPNNPNNPPRTIQPPARPSRIRTHPQQENLQNNSSAPVPPIKHPLRGPEYLRVHNSPPSSVIDADYEKQNMQDPSESPSTINPPSIQPNHLFQYRNPNPDMNVPYNRQYLASPPPPYPQQNAVSTLRIICQRYVIVNQLRNIRGRRDETAFHPQNKLYKGHHILSGLNVIIKEFSSQVSWEYETTYLKELKSRHVVKWIDMDSDPNTGEFYSITEYYGRSLQLEASKFDLKKMKNVFKNICSALSWIHSKDVVHLDLNPSNIICKEGKEKHKIRICDFETSRQFGDVIQFFPPAPPDMQSLQAMQQFHQMQQMQMQQMQMQQMQMMQPMQQMQPMIPYDPRSQFPPNPQYPVFPQFNIGYTCPELLIYYEDSYNEDQNNGMGTEIYANFNQDLFSLGCILYFLHTQTNKVLYSSIEELGDYVSSERGFEYKVRKDIDDDSVADLILKCINRRPNMRPSIEDVLDDEYFNEGTHSRNSHGSVKSDNGIKSESSGVKTDSDDEDDDSR